MVGMCSGDDMRVANGTESLRSQALLRGGEPERLPSPAKVSKQVSEGREFVATLKVDGCDISSQLRNHRGPRRQVLVAGVDNHAHANQTIDISGAVKLIRVLRVCAAETEVPTCSVQPRNQRNQTAAQPLSVAGVVRFARLCVLI